LKSRWKNNPPVTEGQENGMQKPDGFLNDWQPRSLKRVEKLNLEPLSISIHSIVSHSETGTGAKNQLNPREHYNTWNRPVYSLCIQP
jgi:hypothetical protein